MPIKSREPRNEEMLTRREQIETRRDRQPQPEARREQISRGQAAIDSTLAADTEQLKRIRQQLYETDQMSQGEKFAFQSVQKEALRLHLLNEQGKLATYPRSEALLANLTSRIAQLLDHHRHKLSMNEQSTETKKSKPHDSSKLSRILKGLFVKSKNRSPQKEIKYVNQGTDKNQASRDRMTGGDNRTLTTPEGDVIIISRNRKD